MYSNRIKKIRLEKGMTLENLAGKCGISVGYLCHLEKGRRKNPSITIMENLAKALDKTVSEIFFE